MKKIIILLLLIVTTSTQAQTPWRNLTISNSYGIGFKNNSFNMTSANVYYELNKGIAITSWTGLNIQKRSNPGWISSQATVVKKFKKLSIGTGIQYNGSQIIQPNIMPGNNIYVITTASYSSKLR